MNIVILGGGFGGIRCALDLEKRVKGRARIILVDKNNYHLFAPNLYEVASAYGMPEDKFNVNLRQTVSVPYDTIFEGKEVEVIEGDVVGVDIKSRQLVTRGGELILYDYLVLGVGSQASDFGIPGVQDYAFQFKTVEHAVALNQKIISLFEQAQNGLISPPITFLVIGAGANGIELASEIACFAKKTAKLCGMNKQCFSILLFESGPKIMPMVGDQEREGLRKRLTELGIGIMENSHIEEVFDDYVKINSGHTVKGSLVVWTAGVKASEFLKTIEDLPLTDKGKIIVDENLRIKGNPTVFALGDCIEFVDPKNQKPIPGLAYTAVKQGSLIAKNITALASGKKLKKYSPKYDQWILPVGGKYAVAHINKNLTVQGFFGWVVRQFADLRYLVSILSLSKAFSLFRKDMKVFLKNDR